jgi:hypothetical protein
MLLLLPLLPLLLLPLLPLLLLLLLIVLLLPLSSSVHYSNLQIPVQEVRELRAPNGSLDQEGGQGRQACCCCCCCFGC